MGNRTQRKSPGFGYQRYTPDLGPNPYRRLRTLKDTVKQRRIKENLSAYERVKRRIDFLKAKLHKITSSRKKPSRYTDQEFKEIQGLLGEVNELQKKGSVLVLSINNFSNGTTLEEIEGHKSEIATLGTNINEQYRDFFLMSTKRVKFLLKETNRYLSICDGACTKKQKRLRRSLRKPGVEKGLRQLKTALDDFEERRQHVAVLIVKHGVASGGKITKTAFERITREMRSAVDFQAFKRGNPIPFTALREMGLRTGRLNNHGYLGNLIFKKYDE